MPLSKKRDRERKRFQPNSNLTSSKPFQPKQEKIRELRELIDNKSRKSLDLGSFAEYADDVIIPDIDADGHAIPEF